MLLRRFDEALSWIFVLLQWIFNNWNIFYTSPAMVRFSVGGFIFSFVTENRLSAPPPQDVLSSISLFFLNQKQKYSKNGFWLKLLWLKCVCLMFLTICLPESIHCRFLWSAAHHKHNTWSTCAIIYLNVKTWTPTSCVGFWPCF